MRYVAKVGYGVPTDKGNGVWADTITERTYKAEVLAATRSLEESAKVNDDIRLSNRIVIVADAFARDNFLHIKYVSWAGSLWAVSTVEVERPRLTLSLGGVYNGPHPAT